MMILDDRFAAYSKELRGLANKVCSICIHEFVHVAVGLGNSLMYTLLLDKRCASLCCFPQILVASVVAARVADYLTPPCLISLVDAVFFCNADMPFSPRFHCSRVSEGCCFGVLLWALPDVATPCTRSVQATIVMSVDSRVGFVMHGTVLLH